MATIEDAWKAAAIVRDAGGRIVGRTRLQKIAFLLEAAGLGSGFRFKYKHYGPYSEELTNASRTATVLGYMTEVEQPATWGGSFSTFEAYLPGDPNVAESRRHLSKETVTADAVELELAATALFLAREGFPHAWAETARRKPEKAADGRLDRARSLYERIRQVKTPNPLPPL
jgi:uncharacterized protein YwgA